MPERLEGLELTLHIAYSVLLTSLDSGGIPNIRQSSLSRCVLPIDSSLVIAYDVGEMLTILLLALK